MFSTADILQIHTTCSYAFLGLSLALNALVVILIRKAEKLDSFRFVFYAHCVSDTIFAIVNAISLMYWAHLPNIVLFFPTGPLAYMQTLAYVFIVCLICSTFLHRFKAVKKMSPLFASKAVAGLVFLPVIQWGVTCALLMEPEPQLRVTASQLLGSKYGVDFERIYLIGIDITAISSVDPILIASTFSILVEMMILFIVIVWSGYGIHRYIKLSIVSYKSRKIQQHVLRILVFQAIHPLIVLLSPSFLNFAQVITGFRFSDQVNLLLALSIVFYPVSNPIGNLFLSKDLTTALVKLLMHLLVGSSPHPAVTVLSHQLSVISRDREVH